MHQPKTTIATKLIAQWVETWDDPHAGYLIAELHQDEDDGSLLVSRGDAIYLRDAPDMIVAHHVFRAAQQELRRGALR